MADEYPNVVRLDIPTNSREEGAAWIYVPSKNTIYIGPQGSNAMDLTDTIKHVIDIEKGEQLVSGIQYEDGYADYFQSGVSPELDELILDALRNYYDVYGPGSGYETGSAYTDDWPLDDGDDYGDIDDTERWAEYWKRHQDDDSRDRDPSKDPKGVNTSDWDNEKYKGWREQREHEDAMYQGSPREAKPHFRWSYGDSSISPGAPHEGLFMWPVQNGYPDHFSQTGWEGLAHCAQGRVYPHQGDRYEILLWPQRPRDLKDPALKKQLQNDSLAAAQQWVMDKLEVPEENTFFTVGDYYDMVSAWDSPSYPNWGSRYKKEQDAVYSDDDSDGEYVDENGFVYRDPTWTPPTNGGSLDQLKIEYDRANGTDVALGPGRRNAPDPMKQKVDDRKKVIDKAQKLLGVTPTQWYALTPEEKYEAETRVHELQQAAVAEQANPSGVPYSPGMSIADRAGQVHVITPEEYEQAVAENGDKWWEKWLRPEKTTV